jgi:hypothetical protein
LSRRAVAVRLFITCWLLYALHFATNTVREIYPALSLGDHLSFDVSEYAGFHPDIFEISGRGAFINNNPGAALLAAVPYALARPFVDRVVSWQQRARAVAPQQAPAEYQSRYPMAREFYRKARERGLDVKFGLGAGVMQALCMAPLSALSVVVMFYILTGLTVSPRAATVLALLYAVATPVFYRTAQLNQNLLVAHCAWLAFALLWRPWAQEEPPRSAHFLLAGLIGGWAVVCDYSGVVVLAVLSAYAMVRWHGLPAAARTSAAPPCFFGGVALSVAVLLWYQAVCFGSPWYPAQHYMPPARFTHMGYVGMSWPHLDLLRDTAFSLRFGLFTSAPLLALALYPPAWAPPIRLMGRREMWCILALCVLFFVFCSANQYGRLQFNSGVRHVVPVAPFLFLIAAGVLRRLPVALAVCAAIATAYWSWCLAMYRDVEQGFGVLEALRHITLEGVRLPWLTTLQQLGYAWSAHLALPLLALFSVTTVVMWSVGGSQHPGSGHDD